MAEQGSTRRARFFSGRRSLIAAAGIVVTAAIAVELSLHWIGSPAVLSEVVALGVFPAVGKVRGWLEGRGQTAFLPAPEGIVRREGFTLPPYELVIYGALLSAVAVQIAGFVGGLVGRPFLDEGDSVVPVLVVANLFGSAIVIYFLAVWIGSRAQERALLTVIGAVLIGRVLGVLIDFVALPASDFEEVFDRERTVGAFIVLALQAMIFALILALVVGSVGVWQGRRRQEAAYFQYLVKRLDPADRDALLGLAYDEVMRKAPASTAKVDQPAAAPG
jgi:hypothetical protein